MSYFINQSVNDESTGFSNVYSNVSSLVSNYKIKSLFQSYGSDVMNVTWEDTARSKNSCWGPNISDMTLCLSDGTRMPVIRKPNFADVTSDFDIEKLSVVVGNEKGTSLTRISLKEYLENISKYTSENVEPMYLSRDSKVLTSSQCCILPCEKDKVDFSVKLYNYQSYSSNPRVLVIVSSSKGTSCQIVNGNTELNFNDNGQAARFRVQRLEDDRKERGVTTTGKITQEEKQNNVLFIYQIPLQDQPTKGRLGRGYTSYDDSTLECCCVPQNSSVYYEEEDVGGAGGLFGGDDEWGEPVYRSATLTKSYSNKASRGFDHGILSVGEKLGPYSGVGPLKLKRDDRYPIRLTIQHYRVTDSVDKINSELVKEITNDINKVYSQGENVSSLVVEGDTKRVTEPKLGSTKPKESMSFFSFDV
jgi:hypothetical protein